MRDVLRGDQFGISDCWGAGDPSGFETVGFPDADVEHLCDLTHRMLEEILSLAPPSLKAAASARLVPLRIYAMRGKVLGRLSYTWPNNTLQWEHTPMGLRRRSDTMPLCEIQGLLLKTTLDKVRNEDPALLSVLFHEILHGIIGDGVVSSGVFNDAVAMQIQKRHRPWPNSYLTNIPWMPAKFRGTTGFRAQEFGNIRHSRNSNHAWHITMTHVLNDIPSEAIWQICSSLTQRAHTAITTPQGSRYYHPQWSHIVDAVTGELGAERGGALLEALPFQPLQNGKHTLHLPAETDPGRTFSFTAEENPHYSVYDGTGGCDSTAFNCRDI
ncbi:MAG: hypothetical protein PHI23_01405 [Candidatus Peribacteraceae bacterium]|nr:hypothetical protein [Candidatus Peribacteraceae bacterium]